MVAAPESIAQAPVAAPPTAAVKLANGVKAAVQEVGGETNGVEGTGAQGEQSALEVCWRTWVERDGEAGERRARATFFDGKKRKVCEREAPLQGWLQNRTGFLVGTCMQSCCYEGPAVRFKRRSSRVCGLVTTTFGTGRSASYGGSGPDWGWWISSECRLAYCALPARTSGVAGASDRQNFSSLAERDR